MPAYNGNNMYLSLNGFEVMADFKKVNLEPSLETVETTRGAGTEHKQRNPGLNDTKMGVTLGYDTARIQQQIRYLKPGKYVAVFGPEGAIAGKPKHVQEFIMTGAPLEIVVEKGEVAFDISLEAADKPLVDMFNGGTF